ncbi:hypothetical protein L596_019430 [Steinernema carpocapsae]|uniref:Uncharacterized protein n=1 Tax=Steinernema carpocapsae TaxID=34508 RepID=A0A4U5MQP2_STECR|nr:hypothetical protein L596_019430 [Steinernema carpocapsae]
MILNLVAQSNVVVCRLLDPQRLADACKAAPRERKVNKVGVGSGTKGEVQAGSGGTRHSIALCSISATMFHIVLSTTDFEVGLKPTFARTGSQKASHKPSIKIRRRRSFKKRVSSQSILVPNSLTAPTN